MDQKISLIISFYNRIDYLKLLFASLKRQTFRDFEVIIADDGSRQEVVKEVLQLLSESSFKTQHIWHEDKGWRKTVILNKAILASNTDYLVFVDGDCFLHKKFLEEHYLNKNAKTVLVGRRVNLSAKISKILNPAKIEKGYLEGYSIFINLLWHKLSGSGSHVENAIFIKSRFLRRFLNKKRRGILGSNFSVH
ncbi:MAG: glycosyltransferase [Bacteroidales bacterium]|nr:glycosyltransferase [Bacteroidales bacterium]